MSMMLRKLLAFGFVPEYEIVGAEAAGRRIVRAVVAVTSGDQVDRLRPGQFAVLDHPRFAASDPGLAGTISRAAERRSAGLLVHGSVAGLPPATRALAERSELTVVLTEQRVDARRLGAAMDHFVRSPEHANGTLINTVSRRLATTVSDAEGMVRVLSTTLRCRLGLLDAEGRQVMGDLPAEIVRSAPFRLACGTSAGGHGQTQQVRALDDDSLLIIQPVRLDPASPLNLRLVAMVPNTSVAFARTTSVSLSLAGWAFVAHLATVAVALERRNKPRAALLVRLLAEADAPSPEVLAQATAAGWRLGGRHTAVHVRAIGQPVPGTADRLREELMTRGLAADPVRHDDGWVLWLTDLGPEVADALVATVRDVLLDLERSCSGVRMCAGVGVPGDGTRGLRESLQDARRACAMAAARDVAGAVERIGVSNVKRLLSDQHATPSLVDLAERLLRPLTSVDASGYLTLTLSCYLDNESSATATALRLGVHRNTVLQRLDRIRALLDVELNEPDERLALHLATRLVRGGPAAGVWQEVLTPGHEVSSAEDTPRRVPG
ncbi:PucR family transcriptional regulator [Actinophytocola sp. NPDC049390]|uniref:PucR family transcriptional regulator n=1 Tax=Actinophytocola sp. NPDC049390 TaxID=3363894 RepID=UPI0037A2F012